MTTDICVLGIDPGLDRTGWAVVKKQGAADPFLVSCGLLHTPAGMPLPKRLAIIFEGMTEVIETARPDCAAMEKMFFAKRAASVAATIQARGVILLALELGGLATGEYSPPSIKSAIAGSGAADKAQMQRMVQVMLKLKETLRPDDVADAAAIALTHIKTAPFTIACQTAREAL